MGVEGLSFGSKAVEFDKKSERWLLERLALGDARVRYGTFSLVEDKSGRASTKRGDFEPLRLGWLGRRVDRPENS